MQQTKTSVPPSMKRKTPFFTTRKMTIAAMMSAVASVLMFFSFNVPLMPSFIKMDLSELPALLTAFALGPIWGAVVCLIKNLVNLFFSTTGGIGELSNLMLGVCFVVPAGIFYQRGKSKKSALIGSVIGAVAMGLLGVITNYYIVYPVYFSFMPQEVVLDMYRIINPNVSNLWDALIWFNLPFTFIKGMVSVLVCIYVYKPLSPILKGRK